jgi:ABC-type antimicrobial peptide transport system permease subunit
VNQAFVKRYFAGRAALGARVHGWGRWFTIVGVANDVKTYRLTDPPTPYFYVPALQVYRPEYGYTFFVRTDRSVDQATRSIADAVRAVDPTVPVYDAMPLASYVGAPLQGARASAQLLALLSAVAALLAASGLYGVMAFAVAQSAKEIGVRMALGAQRSDVARTVAVRSGVLLGTGLITGLAGAVLTARLVSSMLFSVGAGDVAVFALAAGVMTLIAVVATAFPAWRAMNVDPLTALRAD